MSDPELDDKTYNLGQSKKLSTMLSTSGWLDVMKPALESRRGSLQKKMLGLTEHVDFIKTQQAINAIDNIFVFIESIVTLGKEASEYLKAEKK